MKHVTVIISTQECQHNLKLNSVLRTPIIKLFSNIDEESKGTEEEAQVS